MNLDLRNWRGASRAVGPMLALLLATTASAQSTNGQLQGKAVDAVTQAALVDVVVTATSPALQGEQVVVTDTEGEFQIPNLPPGTYLLHLEKEGYKPLNQTDLVVRIDKTIRVTLQLPPESLKAEEVVVLGKPPTVDIGSTQTGTTITPDFIKQLPVAGGSTRSFESLTLSAPGTQDDGFGVSVGGSTSPENNYVIDGVNTTDPQFGLIGSELSVDFVKEVNVVSGGYMAEFGRATGGVVNVVTKSGGNEFSGSVALYASPGLQARARELVRPGQAVSVRDNLRLNANLVMEVGGPIIQDKLWFYAGLTPTITQVDHVRRLNAITYRKGCPVDAEGKAVASADDEHYDHHDLNTTGCAAEAQDVATDTAGDPVYASTTPIAGSEKSYLSQTFTYQYIGKLTYAPTPDHRIALSVWGNPTTTTGPTGDLVGPLSAFDRRVEANVNDYSLRWDGAFFDKKMLVEAVLGWHSQRQTTQPQDPANANQPGTLWVYPHSVTEFEPDAAKFCGDDDASKAYPTCRVVNYSSGGPGFNFVNEKIALDRWSGRLAATNFFRALGHHQVKYGLDYELMRFTNEWSYSGNVVFAERAAGFIDYRRFGYLRGPDDPVFINTWKSDSKTTSLAAFAQDSWRVMDLVTVNAGLRWENQQLYQGDGTRVMQFPNNVMPRVGAVYDWTGSGRSKVFANYGVFYESVPLNLIDRQFPSQTTILGYHDKTKCDPRDPKSAQGACQQPGSLINDPAKDPAEADQKWTQQGGSSTPVDPNTKGQSMWELVAGAEYELPTSWVADARIGLTYTHRGLNRIIEDLSNDGGNTYFLANPGYGLASGFPKPQRDYDALSLTLNKAFAKKWFLMGSYTLSRLYGNFSGLVRPESGQLDPNITSDYDLARLLENRTGVLPNDRTHNLKLFVSRELALTATSSLMLGGTYQGLSGTPINYLGADALYGPSEAFLLPRGSGGRTPWTHDVDVSFRYAYRFTEQRVLTASVEIFNVLNLQQTVSVDESWTNESVLPIKNGKPDDLKNLRNVDNGALATKNPNYGQALAYQSPLSVRLGLKLEF